MTGKKILIVEDERVVALNIQMRLEAAHYVVAGVADSAQSALALVSTTDPDLVLMDVRLKDNQNGMKVAQAIREQFDVPVVYLTAYADAATLNQAQQTEPYGYILKPFAPSDLYTTIEIALKKHQTQTRLQKLNLELKQCVQERTQALKLANQQLQNEIGERQRAEAETRQILQLEQEFEDLKSRFVTTVSHEFRTPLAIIMTSAELIERLGSDCSAERRVVYLHKIREAVRSMTEVLTEMLTLGRANTNALSFNPSWFDLRQFCVTFLKNEMNLGSPPAVDLEILGDRTEVCLDSGLLALILANLLSNAVKYSPNSNRIRLEVQCPMSDAGCVVFRLQDQGIGIPDEDMPRLFESFHRAKNVNAISGMGLGLTLVQECVRLHQGEIAIESKVNQGTIVTVKLPLAKGC